MFAIATALIAKAASDGMSHAGNAMYLKVYVPGNLPLKWRAW